MVSPNTSPSAVSFDSFMTLRRRVPCIALAFTLAGVGVLPSEASVDTFCSPDDYSMTERQYVPSVAAQLMPLADLLATGEGNYNSVNRGWAGDTPGGIEHIMGRTFDEYTVRDVIEMQRWQLYAVGRYQFIPSTLLFAVNASGVSLDDRFNATTQDRLMAALIAYKRPYVLAYLQGSHDDLSGTLDDIAREWASVEYRNGRSYYSRGGNRAKISRAAVAEMLRNIKSTWQDGGLLP